MDITRRLVVPALALALLLGCNALLLGCKKDGEGGSASSEPAKPLITKKYEALTKEDLDAAITGLGWVPGQASSSSGPSSNIMVTARKDAKTPAPRLIVAVFTVPAKDVADAQKRRAAEYAVDVQGSSILGVKYDPADPAASAKTLSRLLGK